MPMQLRSVYQEVMIEIIPEGVILSGLSTVFVYMLCSLCFIHTLSDWLQMTEATSMLSCGAELLRSVKPRSASSGQL